MTIVTNHPDFQVKVKRCAASDKTIILDLTCTNLGDQDITDIAFIGFDVGMNGKFSEAYDDEGNQYGRGTISVKVANQKEYLRERYNYRMISGIPVKVSLRIDGVSTSAENIAYLAFLVNCNSWGIGFDKKKWVTMRNIPITRD